MLTESPIENVDGVTNFSVRGDEVYVVQQLARSAAVAAQTAMTFLHARKVKSSGAFLFACQMNRKQFFLRVGNRISTAGERLYWPAEIDKYVAAAAATAVRFSACLCLVRVSPPPPPPLPKEREKERGSTFVCYFFSTYVTDWRLTVLPTTCRTTCAAAASFKLRRMMAEAGRPRSIHPSIHPFIG